MEHVPKCNRTYNNVYDELDITSHRPTNVILTIIEKSTFEKEMKDEGSCKIFLQL